MLETLNPIDQTQKHKTLSGKKERAKDRIRKENVGGEEGWEDVRRGEKKRW